MAFFAKPQSSAVKIVKPSVSDEVIKTSSPVRKDSVQRQCRNIVIYGRCKYQGMGCNYYHPPALDSAPTTPTVSTPSLKLTASAPAFIPPISAPAAIRASAPLAGASAAQLDGSDTPTTSTPASPPPSLITSQALHAPVFVPKTAAAVAAGVNASVRKAAMSPPPQPGPASIEDWAPVSQSEAQYDQSELSVQQESDEREQELFGRPQLQHRRGYSSFSDYDYQSNEGVQKMESDSSYYDPMEYSMSYETDPMETSYYNQASVFLRQPLNYLLYTPTMPVELSGNESDSHFIPPSTELRQILQERSETIRGVAPFGMTGLPEELQGYHTLVPLEPTGTGVVRRKLGNWHSTIYRAIKRSDGTPYALRRVENYRLMHQTAFAPIEAWSQIQHPNIVPICEAFTTQSFNDSSLVVSYAYYANARTLYDTHIKPDLQQPPPLSVSGSTFYQTRQPPRQQSHLHQQQLVPERTLWSYIIQIASAIKKVHERGLAVRMVDVTKILVTGQNRIRIGSCGIVDVLLHDTQQDIVYLQHKDLDMFGQLILFLCTGDIPSPNNQGQIQKALDIINRVYSLDMQTLAMFFCSKLQKTTIDQVLDMVRGKLLAEQEEALSAVDRLEDELMGELENARLVRLMAKFGFINERPEFARDPRWSETGDRYIIKLFRDYVFHQVDDHGNPLLDLTHVLTCLNKLDAGTEEKVMLVARDEQSCLVVSYKEIKACIATAFDELVRARHNR